jgi:hypothetical protein
MKRSMADLNHLATDVHMQFESGNRNYTNLLQDIVPQYHPKDYEEVPDKF